jgi:ribonuclease E
VCLPREVAYYLLNKKREDLLEIETKRAVSIAIEIDAELVPGQSRITGNSQ